MENIHRLITEVAATTAGFTQEEVDFLVQNITLPDFLDFGFDRGYKHVFIPVSNFGYSPTAACINYRRAVNDNDLLFLAKAAHYMQDLSCVFHTIWNNQNYHKFYEWKAENMVDDIQANLSVDPVVIDHVYVQSVELAEISETYAEELLNALYIGDDDTIYNVSLACVNNAIGYTLGMYQKFFEDTVSGIRYSIPIEGSINAPMIGAAAVFIIMAGVYL